MFRKKSVGKYNKLAYLAAAAVLLLVLGGCAGQDNSGKSLREHGMDLVRVMEEMVKSSDYGMLLDNAAQIEEIRADLAAGDYSNPQAVYEIEIPAIRDILTLADADGVTDSFSDSLKNQLDSKSSSTLVNLLNSRNGYAALATASVYTAGKAFVYEKPTAAIYLYLFEDGYPIAVSFTPGEGTAMTASGTFLITEDFDAQAVQQLAQLLKEFGLECAIRQLP